MAVGLFRSHLTPRAFGGAAVLIDLPAFVPEEDCRFVRLQLRSLMIFRGPTIAMNSDAASSTGNRSNDLEDLRSNERGHRHNPCAFEVDSFRGMLAALVISCYFLPLST